MRRPGGADPGDEADHWLLTPFLFQEIGGVFLGGAADFADHDDSLGFIVAQEHFQTVNEIGAVNRVATNADAGGLAQAAASGLRHDLAPHR